MVSNALDPEVISESPKRTKSEGSRENQMPNLSACSCPRSTLNTSRSHGVAFGHEHLCNRNPALVDDLDVVLESILIGNTPIFPVFLELVKMAIGPAHHRLKGIVEIAQWNVFRTWMRRQIGGSMPTRVIFSW